jgi:hypothetical protein
MGRRRLEVEEEGVEEEVWKLTWAYGEGCQRR